MSIFTEYTVIMTSYHHICTAPSEYYKEFKKGNCINIQYSSLQNWHATQTAINALQDEITVQRYRSSNPIALLQYLKSKLRSIFNNISLHTKFKFKTISQKGTLMNQITKHRPKKMIISPHTLGNVVMTFLSVNAKFLELNFYHVQPILKQKLSSAIYRKRRLCPFFQKVGAF